VYSLGERGQRTNEKNKCKKVATKRDMFRPSLQQDEAHFVVRHLRALVVVQVVLEVTITNMELEFLEECLVLHDIEGVEDVKVLLHSKNGGIVHKLSEAVLSGNVIVAVGRLQNVVFGVTNHSTWQVVERDEIGNLLGASLFHNVRVNDIFTREKPMTNLILTQLRVACELFEIFRKQFVDMGHVTVLGLTHTGKLSSLGNGVELDGALHGHVAGETRETNINELSRVQRSVVVSVLRDGSGDDDTSGVDGLPCV